MANKSNIIATREGIKGDRESAENRTLLENKQAEAITQLEKELRECRTLANKLANKSIRSTNREERLQESNSWSKMMLLELE